MKPYAFGVDIGGTMIKLGLFRTDGALLNKWQIPTRTQNMGQAILPDVLSSIRVQMERAGLVWNDVEGVGVGVPGPVAEDGTVFRCVNLGWDVFNVPQKMMALEPQLARVRAANDVNAAALGELWQGSAKGRSSLFMVTLGTGIGGGVVTGGAIVMGSRGGAGEIGHLCVDPLEPEPCNCGGHGCLEQYCSASGLVRCTQKALARGNPATALKDGPGLTAKKICDAARAGDPLALSLLDQLGQRLGWALTAVAGSVDPEVFVVGGGLSHAGDILLSCIERGYRRYAFHVFRGTEFVLAELGNDAGIYGCIRMLL